MVSEAAFKSGYAYALLFAVAAAVLSALYGARVLMEGIARPMAKMSDGVKCFIAGDYKLASVMPREGWPEAGSLISVLNRLMLELSAYRAFHLNQVVEERAKAQALIDTISDGILLVDDRGQLICCNQYALKLFGIPKLEQNIILPGSLRQKSFSAALCEIMASEETYLKAEVDVPGPDEDYSVCRSFRVTSRRFLLATLKRPGRVIVVRDVTVEKEIESARETFFHMITHDMRAPLCSIQGYAQLLAKTLPASSAAAEKCLQPILRSARRLNGMIEDILNTIKLERGDMKLRNDIVDAGILCAAVFEVHEPLAARKGIELSVLPSQEKMAFSGDNALLERVLSNLVGNALKFTSPGGRVRLSCRVAAGEAVFTVEDTGPGIPKEKQAEIFEKYTQLEEHRHMGFGLGLAMCKMALEIHKGRIWVESEEGKGSRFIFSIPLTASRG
jgi:two-component system phosphate regulon sensor histidine kinase PhoR